MISWGGSPSTVQPTDCAVPKISLTVPASLRAMDLGRMVFAISMICSRVKLPSCLTVNQNGKKASKRFSCARHSRGTNIIVYSTSKEVMLSTEECVSIYCILLFLQAIHLIPKWWPINYSFERNVIWSAVFEVNWRYDPRTCWTILSNCLTNLKNSGDSTNWATKSHRWEQINLLGSCFPVKGMSYERNVIWSAMFEIKWRYALTLSDLNFSGSWDNCLKLSSKCEDHIII